MVNFEFHAELLLFGIQKLAMMIELNVEQWKDQMSQISNNCGQLKCCVLIQNGEQIPT